MEDFRAAPVEDLIEESPESFRVMEADLPQGFNTFLDVADLSFPLDDYLPLEERLVKAAVDLQRASNCPYVVDVSWNLAPNAQDNLRRFFTATDVAQAQRLFQDLKSTAQDIIESDDLGLLELLMRLGIREIAMHTFLFPRLGIGLHNTWDTHQLLYARSPDLWDAVAMIASNHGLVLRRRP